MNKTLKDEKSILQGSKKSSSRCSKRTLKKTRQQKISLRLNSKKTRYFSDETLDLFEHLRA